MTATIYIGDCRETLRSLPAGSVHCVVTSPPYWHLRDYGLPPLVWGGEAGCEHEWGEVVPGRKRSGGTGASTLGAASGGHDMSDEARLRSTERSFHNGQASAFCLRCNAWRGSLGLEPTPELYVEHIVEVFREVRRVLRDDGTVWANWGDSYASQGGYRDYGSHDGGVGRASTGGARPAPAGALKPKDLCGIPWRVAFALQADGWWLRSDIIWHKTNPMPESVRDRPTKSHEYLFLLSKSKRYYYDADAVREGDSVYTRKANSKLSANPRHANTLFKKDTTTVGRNRRTVWTISTHAFKGAHFATFAPALVEPCIKAGTSERGCCPSCGKGWERVVEKQDTGQRVKMPDGWAIHDGGHGSFHRNGREAGESGQPVLRTQTTGWRPGCDCSGLVVIGDQPSKPSRKSGQSDLSYTADLTIWEVRVNKWNEQWESLRPLYEAESTVPAVCLDPFGGSGTVALVAARLGRDAILCELNPEYAAMARRRVKNDAPMFNEVRRGFR